MPRQLLTDDRRRWIAEQPWPEDAKQLVRDLMATVDLNHRIIGELNDRIAELLSTRPE